MPKKSKTPKTDLFNKKMRRHIKALMELAREGNIPLVAFFGLDTVEDEKYMPENTCASSVAIIVELGSDTTEIPRVIENVLDAVTDFGSSPQVLSKSVEDGAIPTLEQAIKEDPSIKEALGDSMTSLSDAELFKNFPDDLTIN